MRVRWLRCRPIGSSTVPPPVMTPVHSARYSRSISRAASAATSAVCASGVRATTSSPLVSLSRRCTRPGARHQGEPGIEGQQRILQRVAGVAGARVHDQAGGLVDDEQRAVLEDHVQRQCLGLRGIQRRQVRLDAHLLPAQHPVLGPRRRPSSSTAPASIQLFRRAREYCGKRRARAWSRRSPAASGGQPQAHGCGTPPPSPPVGSAARGFAILPPLNGSKPRKALPDVPVRSGARRRLRPVSRPRGPLRLPSQNASGPEAEPRSAVQEGAQGARRLQLQRRHQGLRGADRRASRSPTRRARRASI